MIRTALKKQNISGKVKLLSDSSCDIIHIDGVNFRSVPLTVSANGRDYVDDEKLNVKGMIDDLLQYGGRSYTACPAVGQWLRQLEGAETAYMVTMTSGLSGTYNSARAARDLYVEANPDAKVYVFDTLSTGPEQRLLVEKIADWIKAGKQFNEICALGKRYLKKTRLFFSMQNFHNFVQNGRVNKNVGAVVSALKLNVISTADNKGKIKILTACKNSYSANETLRQQLKKAGYKGGRVAICHVQNSFYAEKLRELLHAEFPKAEILVYPARGLCSYYAEEGGLLIGYEKN